MVEGLSGTGSLAFTQQPERLQSVVQPLIGSNDLFPSLGGSEFGGSVRDSFVPRERALSAV